MGAACAVDFVCFNPSRDASEIMMSTDNQTTGERKSNVLVSRQCECACAARYHTMRVSGNDTRICGKEKHARRAHANKHCIVRLTDL